MKTPFQDQWLSFNDVKITTKFLSDLDTSHKQKIDATIRRHQKWLHSLILFFYYANCKCG